VRARKLRTDVPLIDKIIGLLCWVTSETGVQGILRETYEDFVVEEILPNGRPLDINAPVLEPSGYEGLFTHFILIKKGIGNFEAFWILSKKLGVPISFFFYSGNKDKDALTIQRAAVWGVPPEKLQSIELPNELRILSPIRELRRIHIGDHKGNRFTITIRRIPNKDASKLDKVLYETERLPIPNFFGYQRFGLVRPITHIVGKLLLLRRYDEALTVYLTAPGLTDSEDLLFVKELIRERNYSEALKSMPQKGLLFEKVILRNLIRYGTDYHRILKRLPPFLLRMLIEAYQGYIFNKILSRLLIENPSMIDRYEKTLLPLVGYKLKIPNDEVGRILKEILDDENIKLNLFKNRHIPSLSSKGSLRPAFLHITFEEKSLEKTRNNTFNLRLRFSLGKGQYATVVLREILKENFLAAHFGDRFEKKKDQILANMKKLTNLISEMNLLS